MITDNQQQNETQPYPSWTELQPPTQPDRPYQQPPTPPTPKEARREIQRKKLGKKGKFFAIGCGSLVALVVLITVIAIAASAGGGTHPATVQEATQPPDAGATAMAGNTPVTSQPTQAVQPTTAPAQSAAQIESAYKASTTDTTVSGVDKNGSSWTGKDVHFTAVISGLVKDDSGNTAGANVSDPTNEFGHDIQVGFPAGTDINKLNQGDTIEVWGTDGGTQSGANAFGATVQEVVVGASYLTDTTTGYQDNG